MNRCIAAWGVIGMLAGSGVFPVVHRAVAAAEPATMIEVQRLLADGRKLTAEQSSALEDAVKRKPDDADSRIKLLAYLLIRQSTPEARKARQAHVIWLIENQPRSPVHGTGYAGLNALQDGDDYFAAKTLWNKQVEMNPKDTVILGNAAEFLLLGRREEAQALLERCVQIEPENEAWHRRLGHLVRLNMNRARGDERMRFATQAVAEFEQALKLSGNEAQKSSLVVDLAKTSFEAGDYEKARRYAQQLLDGVNQNQKAFNTGNAIHDGNVVLGRLALVAGDVAAARRHLLAAGQTPGSPNLNSFGPNMSLAKELLERGETQTVLEYFELCAKFWSGDRGKLKAWGAAAKAGIAPDFQANLVY
jgi:tetratricopeptide (TPR) repeat protein